MKKVLFALTAMVATGVVAADEASTKGKLSGESELGYVWKSGNTKSETLNAKQRLVYDANPWVNTFLAEASNTTTTSDGDKERIGERYFVSDQVDFFVSSSTYTFLRGTGEKDRFNGFDFRSTWVLGVGHEFVNNDSVTFKGEAGAGHAIELTDKDVYDEYRNGLAAGEKYDPRRRADAMGYLAESLVWKFSSNAELGQSARSEYTRFNTNSRLDVYVRAMLVGNLAMKATYTLRYNNKPPVDTRHKDEEVTISLAYSF